MCKIKALVLPSAKQLEKVCPPDVRDMIDSYFDACFNLTGEDYTKE